MAIPSKSFIIAGTHSGVGKTTIAIGLMTALRKRGFTVQPFKAGPDYIDPSFHMMVCGRPSYNLDTWMMENRGVKNTFAMGMENAQIGIVEGVMGLFDGKDEEKQGQGARGKGQGSTADIAKVLRLPVILIVDAKAMAQSAGAIVYGFERFDPDVKIAGVIFNRVGSSKHFEMLKVAVEKRCRAKVLGYIPWHEEISLPERHLGLVMQQEARGKKQEVRLKKIGELIERFVDVEGILRISPKLKAQSRQSHTHLTLILSPKGRGEGEGLKIAVAYDNAFCFYYQENLDMLKEFGAELSFFSPLKDERLPDDINGIYLGGGYPELYAKRLSANKSLAREIKNLAEKGLTIYAECGGLMYLGKGLKDLKGRRHDMVGLFPYISEMSKKRMTLGYREVIAADGCPFLRKGQKIRGHEFHYSDIDEPPDRIRRVYHITHNPPSPPFNKRGQGGVEGYLYKNTLVSYIHLHFASNPRFAEGFVKKCSKKR